MELVDGLRRERTEDRALGNYLPIKTKQKKGEKRTEKWSEEKELLLCRVMSQKSLEEGVLRKQILRDEWKSGGERVNTDSSLRMCDCESNSERGDA